MKRFFLLITLVSTLAIGTQAQDDKTSLERLGNFAQNLLAYNSQYTQEKVYLHLDNNGYLPGETIWFKAYVFKASSLLPTDMSKVLYVELLNPDGQVMERKTLPVTNGRTYGDFRLNQSLCRSGYYELRAYTRAMLNWDQSYIFSRVIPIFEAPEDSVNFSDLNIGETEYTHTKMPNMRTAPKVLVSPTTQKSHSTMLTFYPEGGYITQGLPTNVAFKLTDSDGLPETTDIKIVDNSGNEILSSPVFHDGMGVFALPATWSGGSAKLLNNKGNEVSFKLPEMRPVGSDLHVTCDKDSGLCININSSDAMVGKMMGLSVTCRTKLLYFSDLTLEKQNTITIPYDKLRDGILQITLFSPEGEILSERLAWCPLHQAEPTMTIRQNQEVYKPFSPIVLDIALQDAEGNPLRGDFSIAVRDAETDICAEAHGLPVEMLMASELKGYIHKPEFYFEADDNVHRKALDLLLMVQGWRRYSWTEMAGIDTFELKQPMEDGLLLFGSLTNTNAAEKALEKTQGLNLNFMMTQNGKASPFTVKTEADGSFALKLRNFYGDCPTVITITDDKDKRIYTDLKINRNFTPPVLPYEPLAIASLDEIKSKRITSELKPDLFDWKDTIPDLIGGAINLKMVTVTGKRIQYGYQPSLRYRKGASEDYTKTLSRFYYNLSEELDKYQDEGNAVPVVWEWLASVNPLFEYDMGDTIKLRYHNLPVNIIIDSDRRENGRLAVQHSGDPMMHEFRSLVVVENSEAVNDIYNNLNAGEIGSILNPRGATVFLYSKEEVVENNYYKRGTRWLTLHGYSKCDEFYSPDYRQSEEPTATDHRRTLYWNPSLVTDENGKANLVFYSSSRPQQRLHINAQGIAVNGQMFEKK